MKKLILIAVMAVCTLAANAQFYVEGTLGGGVSTAKVSVANLSESATTKKFNLAAGAGYNITDRFAVGLNLGWDFNKVEEAPSITVISGSPYLRYHFAKISDNVSLFTDLGAEFGFVSAINDMYDSGYFAWGIGLAPGISFKVNDHVNILGQINLASYAEINAKEDALPDVKTTNTAFSFLPSEAKIGIQYNF